MHEVEQRLPQELGLRVAEQRGHALIDERRPTGVVEQPYALVGGLDDAPVALFALAQRPLGDPSCQANAVFASRALDRRT
jgi:hypothetical protein